MSNTVRINGVTITDGKSIRVINGNVYIDGNNVTPDGKQITIEVQGNVDHLEVDACDRVSVNGNVGSLSTHSGAVECGPVSGNVKTMSGGVDCDGDIGGSVQTMSGNVTAKGRISGSSDSMSGRIRT